jgi:hypothetical protein
MAHSSSPFFTFILNAVDQPSGIARLVDDILSLSGRLAQPEQQSDYFRWGLENHIWKFHGLCREYQGMRHWYNMHSVDDILEERARVLQKSRLLVAGEMNMGRALMLNAAKARIAWLDECLRLKANMPEMPALDALLERANCPDIC